MKKIFKFPIDDLLYFAGAALISYGAWTIYPPAGFISAGIILSGSAILHARNEKKDGNS